MSDLGWSAAALLVLALLLVFCIAALIAYAYLHEEARERRAIIRWRRKRRRAWETLRSTAQRNVYQEFERSRRS